MSQPPHEDRRAAAAAFIESLTQLEQTLELAEAIESTEAMDELPPQKFSAPPDASNRVSKPDTAQFSLSSFEDAIADLEQFLQNNSDLG